MAPFVQSMPQRAPSPMGLRIPWSWVAATVVALTLVLGLRWFWPWFTTAPVSEMPAPAFVAYAMGRVPSAAPLLVAPEPSAALAAQLPAGGRVDIGGRIDRRGFGADLLWVATTIEGVRVYGFLQAAAVDIEAGDAPPLDLRGVPLAALLSPDAGVRVLPLSDSGDLDTARVAGEDDVADDAIAPGLQGSSPDERAGSGAPAVADGGPVAIDIAWLPATLAPWRGLLEAAGVRHGVDPELLAIIALVESGGDPGARSGAGAMGLMQVMPGTAADIARWRGIQGFRTTALHEPAVSIDFGAWYLARQLATFGLAQDPDWQTSVQRAAAAYNGGPGSVSAWLAGRALPAEAERYRGYVGGMWSERTSAQSATYDRWLRAGGSRLVAAAEARQRTLAVAGRLPTGSALEAGALAAGAVAVTNAGNP